MKWLAIIATWLCLWLIPTPEGLEPRAWHLFGLFVPTILGVILKPMPMAPVCIISLAVAMFSGVIDLSDGLQGFSAPVIWLIVLVFFIARGFIKTRLGERIAYIFVSILGKKSLGLGYGITLTELIIAPFVPSNAARVGGIIFPILQSINHVLGSSVEDGTQKKIGSYLVQVTFHINIITGAMFLTAMAANPLAQAIAAKHGVDITWWTWTQAALVPGIISLILIPLVLYVISPPEVKHLPEALDLAKIRLKDMGPLSKNEWLMIGIFGLMIVLWIGEKTWNIPTTQTAFLGIALMFISRILTWKDVQEEHEAWSILVWISIIIMMSNLLNTYGFMKWFSTNVSTWVYGVPWTTAFATLSIVYFYSHYFFASNTAHVSAMYAGFLSVSIMAGTPPLTCRTCFGFCKQPFFMHHPLRHSPSCYFIWCRLCALCNMVDGWLYYEPYSPCGMAWHWRYVVEIPWAVVKN